MRENKKDNIINLLKRLWSHIQSRRKKQLMVLFALIVISSFAEMISIGAVFPFLAALTNPDKLYEIKIIKSFFEYIGVKSSKELLLPISIIFAITAMSSGGIRLLLLWANNKISFATGADFNFSIFKKTLYQTYAVHIARNSSEIISGITDKSYVLIKSISDVLTIFSSLIVFTSVLIMLISIDPIVALSSFIGFGGIYFIVILSTRKVLSKNSKKIALDTTRLIQSLQEALGGIRDVLIDGTQAMHCNIYRNIDLPLRKAQAVNQIIYNSPRYMLESLGIILIIVVAYFLSNKQDGISKAIPVLGILALGAQKMLPVLQQAYGSWSSLYAYKASIIEVLKLLDQPMPEYYTTENKKYINFNSNISLNNISFRYGDNMPNVINNVSINIKKGSTIGIIGTTGSGKTTLLDIIMGLLHPKDGSIEIDGVKITNENYRSWQSMIAHVPQTIYLADTTISENIAFGVPTDKIDFDKVIKSCEKAQISQIIDEMPEKYNTKVGERGVRLSGGQRQRIGIARALYKNAQLIILDEATSALDTNTETAVMNAIEKLNKNITLIIIAHRITTLKNCDNIIEIENGRVKREVKYSDLI